MSPPINLMPPERVCRRLASRRIRTWVLVVVGCASVALPVAGLMHESADSGLVERLGQSSARVDEVRARITMLEMESVRLEHQARVAQLLANRPEYALLINAVGEAVGDQVAIERISIERVPDASGALRPTLMISGLTQNQIEAQQLAVDLQGLDVFLDVNLLESRRRTSAVGDLVGFRLAGVLDGVQP